MTLKSTALSVLIIIFLGGIALLMWINTSVLCLGDQKFDMGCGGFSLYFPIWVIFYAPLGIAAVILVIKSTTIHITSYTWFLVFIYAALIIIAVQIFFMLDTAWTWLVIANGAGAVLFVILYKALAIRLTKVAAVKSAESYEPKA